jgi:hypothetical protein
MKATAKKGLKKPLKYLNDILLKQLSCIVNIN